MILICFSNYNKNNVNNFKILKTFEKIFRSNSFFKKINLLLSVVAISYIVQFLIENRIDLYFNKNALVLSPLLWLAYLLFAISWTLNINDNKFKKEYVFIWFNSVIGKYLPLKVGIPMFRLTESRKIISKLNTKNNIQTLLIEQFFLMFWGAYIGIFYFFNIDINNYIKITTAYFFAIFLILFLGKIFNSLTTYRNMNLLIATGQFLIYIFLLNLFNFEYSYFNFQYIYAYFLVSSLSLIFIGAPAGLGVRELLFVEILGGLENPEILAFAIYVRIIYLVNEILLTFISRLFFSLSK